jgi:1,4-dihydroxy-6-naphthoate synthase
MLDAGAALGYGCGPLLLRRAGHEPQELAKSKIAVPGQLTTAGLLFSLYSEGVGELVNMPFDRIMDSLADGDVDYGVVIHEGRFVYSDRGLECVVDLGEWWEGENGLPVPLGCIAAKRSLGDEFAAEFSVSLRESIARTREDPEAALPLIRKYAQEMDATVLEQHISTYVNEFSLELGPQGREAVELMARKAREAGIIK